MKLSIIIPVFNEEKTIEKVVGKVYDVNIKGITKEIIIVNDGSTDTTNLILKTQYSKLKNITIITHNRNQGKGAAVKTGIENAVGDYILIQDADLEYNPDDIEKLVKPILEKKAVVVYGTRLKRLPNFSRDERTLQFLIHYIGNKFLSLLTSLLYGQWITDMETGYKLIPRYLFKDITLRAKSFDFEPEITAKLLRKGIKIYEVQITTNPRGYNEGKKLNTVTDGIIAFITLIKYRI